MNFAIFIWYISSIHKKTDKMDELETWTEIVYVSMFEYDK